RGTSASCTASHENPARVARGSGGPEIPVRRAVRAARLRQLTPGGEQPAAGRRLDSNYGVAAAATAAAAFTIPVPHWLHGAGNACVVFRSNVSTCVGVRALFTASISAATPATCGVAIEVP